MRNNAVDIIPQSGYNRYMNYLKTAEIAKLWGISDRRVRTLCSEGRVAGVVEVQGTYLIPEDAEKPNDKRYRKSRHTYEDIEKYAAVYLSDVRKHVEEYDAEFNSRYYLKWADDVIGLIDAGWNVRFTDPRYNSVVAIYTRGCSHWTRDEFKRFLEGRIVSRDRRDIERILFRCGLSEYDSVMLGKATRAVSAADLIWIADNAEQRMEDAVSEVFDSVFLQKIDAEGASVDTPEGANIKRYGVCDGKYGIYKKRISPLSTDTESELAVYKLAKRLGVKCCPVRSVDEDTVFSEFEYDFAKEYIVHFRRLFTDRGENEYLNLLAVRPQYQADIIRMIALDFITRQDDRHLSNIAVKVGGASESGSSTESFYPLYDNGRSLFYEDTEETAARAVADVALYSTGFGPVGTYYDCVMDIAASGIQFSKLMNLDIDESEVADILESSRFKGYRLEYGCKWIMKTIEILKSI